ncbi:hypothetical protein E6P09_06080 [Haloferax mediterranei ATCC 33500]|uniref:Uncharacterized protein n=1 Tax=Haloferax mediterranei (strain ATCC 33500 / DSM 1411 / JCM 8866 / NBRC 14739 / NCIMB 2177 / R-4) TaxID=523841 RepID=I3R273_HALMT|nr:hypothetical protein [Haloferax mediterranei]AFK18333.1 hypothetical protein HFX_0608 [Haloferax mediterranei ATCC 33500]AHZ22270.1 hypothetical protein BM92_06220 [Haloferax mediterranei ATCC 33500]EMA02397.1 hypothetical protein C439_07440 [Haloferax mediterranei ATCC 33500]MDX5988421.1 hypothetical protein [Haloferax mediterranei ATCC 33500]QCQ74845.1 hypothetical protein E6P09_06080 [Haloferax mediterranei ATCC 33500]
MPAEPDHPTEERPPLVEQATVRLRIVGTAVLVGVLISTGALAGTVLAGAYATSVDTAFALGSLVFGFGLLGWSGAVALGRGIESMQNHLDTGTGWTEPDARRAMARILGFGLGVMLGTMGFGSVLVSA